MILDEISKINFSIEIGLAVVGSGCEWVIFWFDQLCVIFVGSILTKYCIYDLDWLCLLNGWIV